MGKAKFSMKSEPVKALIPAKAVPLHEVSQSDIDALVKEAQKIVGKEVFSVTKDRMALLEVSDWIPMPKPISDMMSCPGIPCGQVMEIYGKKDSGKTTYATEVLIQTQRAGGIAMLLDTENKFSIKRAINMGLNEKKLVIIQAKTIEEAFEKFKAMVELIVKNPKYHHRKVVCVWDSLGQTPTEAELDDDSKHFAMIAAGVIKRNLRKLVQWIGKTNVAFVIINQVYGNTNPFGKKTTPYGGSGPDYASVIQLECVNMGRVRPKGVKAETAPMAGTKVQIECVKNHLGQPFKKVNLLIDWRGFAIDRDVEYQPE